jgi:hypothetical protein
MLLRRGKRGCHRRIVGLGDAVNRFAEAVGIVAKRGSRDARGAGSGHCPQKFAPGEWGSSHGQDSLQLTSSRWPGRRGAATAKIVRDGDRKALGCKVWAWLFRDEAADGVQHLKLLKRFELRQ